MRGFAVERLLPIACLGGAIILFASQFMTIFELNSAGGVTERLVDSTDQHWYAMAILGGFAALATIGAIAAGSRPLALAVAIFGITALFLILVLDLPDAGKTDNISDPIRSFVTVEAEPQGGFWLELIGALILAVCGGAMSTLSPEQLRALRPRRRERRGDRERPPGAAAPREPRPARTLSGRRSERTSERT
jgi:MFS family permease